MDPCRGRLARDTCEPCVACAKQSSAAVIRQPFKGRGFLDERRRRLSSGETRGRGSTSRLDGGCGRSLHLLHPPKGVVRLLILGSRQP